MVLVRVNSLEERVYRRIYFVYYIGVIDPLEGCEQRGTWPRKLVYNNMV